jgi:hypothetical protein
MSFPAPHTPALLGEQPSAASSPGAFDMQALMAHLQQQSAAIASLQAQLAAQAPGAGASVSAAMLPPAARVERPRLPSPPMFEGKASALDDWERTMNKQFAWYHTPDSIDRVHFAEAYLCGAADDWWQHLPPATKAGASISFTAFVGALRQRFQPVTTAEVSRAKLLALSQGKAGVQEYVGAFRRLLTSLSDMSEADRLFHFLRGVKPSIAAQLRMQGVKTVDAAIEMATRIGAQGEFAAITSASAMAHGSSAPMELDEMGIEGREQDTAGDAGAAVAATATGDTPITQTQFAQLLAVMQDMRRARGPSQSRLSSSALPSGYRREEGGRTQYGGLSREVMDAHFAAGTCFECGKAGHQARRCPKRLAKEKKEQAKSSN